MAIINSSGYRILNATTVINILNSSAVQNKNYPQIRTTYYNLKKTSDSKLLIIVKQQYSGNIERIYDDITKLFATDVLLGGQKVFTTGEKSNLLGIDFVLNLQRSTKKVQVFFKSQKPSRPKVPELLRPGVLNEEYFVSKINDQVKKINEVKIAVGLPDIFDPTLNLVLYENNKQKYTINGLSSIERIGQELGKSDVRIKTKNRTEVNISLKKENFSFWGSASKYSAAKDVLDYLSKNNIVSVASKNGKGSLVDVSTGNNLIGIRLKATVGEIKKYCFGGEGNKVDYILIQSFDAGDFKDIRKVGGGQEYKLELNSAMVYKEIANDIIRMRDNVYLTIVPSSDNASALTPNYPGFRIQFATAAASSKYYEPNIPANSLNRL
jgi:hypothetical protein